MEKLQQTEHPEKLSPLYFFFNRLLLPMCVASNRLRPFLSFIIRIRIAMWWLQRTSTAHCGHGITAKINGKRELGHYSGAYRPAPEIIHTHNFDAFVLSHSFLPSSVHFSSDSIICMHYTFVRVQMLPYIHPNVCVWLQDMHSPIQRWHGTHVDLAIHARTKHWIEHSLSRSALYNLLSFVLFAFFSDGLRSGLAHADGWQTETSPLAKGSTRTHRHIVVVAVGHPHSFHRQHGLPVADVRLVVSVVRIPLPRTNRARVHSLYGS